MFKVEGPLTDNTETYAHLIIKPSVLTSGQKLKVSCSSTWSVTAGNNGADSPLTTAVTATASATVSGITV